MKLFDLSKNKNREWLWHVKLSINTSFQFLLAILFFVFIYLTVQTFKEFGWGINEVEQRITVKAQEIRLWMLLFMTLFILCSCYSFYASLGIKEKRWLLFGGGIFTWLLQPYILRVCLREKYFYTFWTYINTITFANNSISHISLYYWLRGKLYFNKVVANTIFYYFMLIIFAMSFAFVFVPKTTTQNYIDETFIFSSLAYFTKLTNIGCFIFLVLHGYFYRKRMSDGNNLLIYMSSYICVVGIVYWVALFPAVIGNGRFAASSNFFKFADIWWHGVAPISFSVFAFTTMWNNEDRPNKFFGNQVGVLISYPSWYCLWAYLTPFFVRASVYGKMTNLNPHLVIFDKYSGKIIKEGDPINILMILVIAALFFLFYVIFTSLNFLIVKSKSAYYCNNHD